MVVIIGMILITKKRFKVRKAPKSKNHAQNRAAQHRKAASQSEPILHGFDFTGGQTSLKLGYCYVVSTNGPRSHRWLRWTVYYWFFRVYWVQHVKGKGEAGRRWLLLVACRFD